MKKQFICSVPIRNDLSKVVYTYPDEPGKKEIVSCFPAVSMICNAVEPGDEQLVVSPIITESSKAAENYEAFLSELSEVEKDYNVQFSIEEPIKVTLDEVREKHIEFFKAVSKCYKPDSKLYVDITYGSKVQSMSTFLSLVMAENAGCSVEEIIYGSFIKSEAQEGKGRIYNLRSLFEISQLLQSCAVMPGTDLNAVLDSIGK